MLFLRHFDKLLLSFALLFLLSALLPDPRASALDASRTRIDHDLSALSAHFSSGAAHAPAPAPPATVSRAIDRLTSQPARPSPLPGWCMERRVAFCLQVEEAERGTPVHEAPAELAADVSSPGVVRLSWRAGVASLVSATVTLERRIDDGPWTQLASSLATTELEDRTAPPRRALSYRLTSRAVVVPPDGEPAPHPLAADRVALSCELGAPVTVRRAVEVVLREAFIPPELSDEPGWATLVVRRLGARGEEISKKTLLRVLVGAPIGDSGATLLELGARAQEVAFANGVVQTPWARIRWPEGDLEELIRR